MNRKLFLSIVFLFSISSAALSQINSDFLNKEKTYSIVNYSEQLPDISTLDQDVRLSPLNLIPSSNFVCPEGGVSATNTVWMGQETQSTIKLYNIPIQTNFRFDLQGRFQSSEMSISLTRD